MSMSASLGLKQCLQIAFIFLCFMNDESILNIDKTVIILKCEDLLLLFVIYDRN